MKKKVKHYTDEFRFQVVQEYLNTDVSQQELLKRNKIRGKNNITNWMRKFDVQQPSEPQIEIPRNMEKQKERTPYERELEVRVRKLEQQLAQERLRALALNTLIDVAERDLKISIRKKAGAR